MIKHLHKLAKLSPSFSLEVRMSLKTAHEQGARQRNATTSCLCALSDKPIRLRAFVRAVRKTNQNSCLCLPGFRFLRRHENRSMTNSILDRTVIVTQYV